MEGYNLENRYYSGVLNLIENLDAIWVRPSLYNLANIFQGIPAMVIGAGPSLESVLPLIREYRDRFVIYSSNSALKTLLSCDIIPQFVVGLELRDETNCFSDLSALSQIYGIFSSCCHPSFYQFSFKNIFIYNLLDFPFGQYTLGQHQFPQIPGGGTVSVPAMFSAYIAGAKEILFLGQDMAFKNRRKYAVGSGGTMIDSDRDFVKVQGINGSTVETSRGFRACIQQVGMMANQLKKRNVICYNMNSEGARIEGLKNERFDEWIKTRRYPKVRDIASVMNSKGPGFVPEKLKHCVQDMIRNMEDLIKDIFVSPVSDLDGLKKQNPMALCFENSAWEAMDEGRYLGQYKVFANQVLEQLKTMATKIERGLSRISI